MSFTRRPGIRVAAFAMLGVAVVAAALGIGRGSQMRTGTMPEVVVAAEMPRLVTDTVFVSAAADVAAVPSPHQVNFN